MGVSKWERAFPQGARLLSFDGKTSRAVSDPFRHWKWRCRRAIVKGLGFPRPHLPQR